MPASAGRVRMPHNNRMSGSSALNTSAIWKDVIKYDPYAGTEESKPEMDEATSLQQQGFMDVVKKQVSAMNQEGKRGACRKCGNVGHLTYQCRNFVDQSFGDVDDDSDSSDDDEEAGGGAPTEQARLADEGRREEASDESDGSPRRRKRSRSRDGREDRRSRSPERKRSKRDKHKKDKKKKDKKKKKEKKHKKEKR